MPMGPTKRTTITTPQRYSTRLQKATHVSAIKLLEKLKN
jgi:hypothetical protein